MKNIDLRIHGGTLCCSMSILTAKLEEAVEQGETVYILVYTLKYKETEVMVNALNMYCILGNI